MYLISKQYTFSASHEQRQLPESYPCSRLHGHNYVAEIILKADALDENGFAFDLADLKPFERLIADKLDHRHLNDVLPGFTSSECLARWLYDQAKGWWPQAVYSVRVQETLKIWAEYRES